jgi:hypothetical protein
MGITRFLGGLAPGYLGYQQGAQDARQRQEHEEDRAFQLRQRSLAEQQQARQLEEQRRSDQLRDDLTAIPTSKDVNVNPNPVVTVDDEGTPSAAALPVMKATPRTEDEMMRDAALSFKKAGQLDKYLALNQKADEIGMQRSAKLFEQVRSSAAGKTAYEIAQQAAEIYNNDPMPAKVTNLKQLDGGGVEVEFNNGGKTIAKQFSSPQQILEVLESYYSPSSYQGLIKARRDAAIKTEEELTKAPVTSVPGGYVDKRSRQFIQTVQPRGAATGAGGAGRGGKAPATPLGEARAILADAFEKGEVKAATPQQRADAEDFVDRVLQQNPGIPPARAAKIAVAASTNPASTAPAIDPKTGSIDLTYLDTDGARYTLTPNYATATDLEKRGIKKEDMAVTVKTMVGAQGDASYQALFQKAAFDPSSREALLTQTKADANKVLQDALAKNAASPAPRAEAEIRQAFDARLNQDIGALERKLDLVKQFGEKPKADAKPATAGARRIEPAAGLPSAPPGSPQAEWNKRQLAAREKVAAEEAAKAEKARQLSEQFQRDKASMKPIDLVQKYDGMRSSLSSADARDLFAVEREIR